MCFSWTVVSSQGPELMNKWLQQVPGRRVAEPWELKGVSVSSSYYRLCAFSDTSDKVYVFLASDACPYMTGAELFVDGAYSLV